MIHTDMAFAFINDITTTPQDPPVLLNHSTRKPLLYPLEFAQKQKAAYPDLGPIVFLCDPELVFKAVEKTGVEILGWKVQFKNAGQKKIQFMDATPLLRFKDDVAVEVRTERQGCSVHVRSRSRLGQWDLGANAKRIRGFLKVLNKILLTSLG